MPVSFEQLLQIAQVVVVGCSAAVSMYVFWRTRTDKRWDAQTERINSLDARMSAVEATLKHMPTHADIDGVTHQIARVDERSATTLASVTRIETYLLGARNER